MDLELKIFKLKVFRKSENFKRLKVNKCEFKLFVWKTVSIR